MAQLRAMGRHDSSARLGSLASIPTLVVSAAHDRIAPPSAGRELAELTRGRYEELDGQSHACVVEQPERVNALLVEHLGAADSKARQPTPRSS
jgi:3-oxoadipate enol-lactonase